MSARSERWSDGQISILVLEQPLATSAAERKAEAAEGAAERAVAAEQAAAAEQATAAEQVAAEEQHNGAVTAAQWSDWQQRLLQQIGLQHSKWQRHRWLQPSRLQWSKGQRVLQRSEVTS